MPFDLNEEFNKPVETQGTPVLDFEGTLKEIATEERKFENPGQETRISQSVRFDFIDCNIIDSSEPYPFPTVRIQMTYTKRENTYWVAWERSAKAIIPPDKNGRHDIYLLQGKKQHWKRGPVKVRAPVAGDNNNWQIQDLLGWQVVSVEGMGGNSGNIFEKLGEMFSSPITDREFYSQVVTNDELKSYAGHSNIVQEAMDRKLITTLEKMGVIREVDGKWVKI